MNIEYIGGKIFLDEIGTFGQVWVLRSEHKNIYSLELDPGELSLPVWSTQDKASNFLKTARPTGPKYAPEAVSLDVFTQAWLSNQAMGISELHINPDGRSSRVLVFTVEEFQASQAAE